MTTCSASRKLLAGVGSVSAELLAKREQHLLAAEIDQHITGRNKAYNRTKQALANRKYLRQVNRRHVHRRYHTP